MDSARSAPPRNIRLTIGYDGTRFHGWQRQAGHVTVQEVLEQCLERLTGERVRLIGSGRTDAGVHALAQAANFHTASRIPLDGLRRGLNSLLPEDVVVLSAHQVPEDFHSIRDIVLKSYCYHLVTATARVPLWETRAWVLERTLDVSAMHKALPPLLGCRDFKAFQASGGSVKSTVRRVRLARLEPMDAAPFPPSGGAHYTFTIAADGFLRYMVRNIVGLLVEIGLGRRPWGAMEEVLASGDRSRAGPTAPPQGLYLQRVFYDARQCPPGSESGLGAVPVPSGGKDGAFQSGQAFEKGVE